MWLHNFNNKKLHSLQKDIKGFNAKVVRKCEFLIFGQGKVCTSNEQAHLNVKINYMRELGYLHWNVRADFRNCFVICDLFLIQKNNSRLVFQGIQQLHTALYPVTVTKLR